MLKCHALNAGLLCFKTRAGMQDDKHLAGNNEMNLIGYSPVNFVEPL